MNTTRFTHSLPHTYIGQQPPAAACRRPWACRRVGGRWPTGETAAAGPARPCCGRRLCRSNSGPSDWHSAYSSFPLSLLSLSDSSELHPLDDSCFSPEFIPLFFPLLTASRSRPLPPSSGQVKGDAPWRGATCRLLLAVCSAAALQPLLSGTAEVLLLAAYYCLRCWGRQWMPTLLDDPA